MNWLLLIDTSIRGVGVGIVQTRASLIDGLDWQEVFCDVNDSAKLLPILVEKGLKHLSIGLDDLEGVVLSIGPGSFTGLRVGASYTFGLLEGLNSLIGKKIKVLGTSSLRLIAQSLDVADSHVKNGAVVGSTKSSGYLVFTNSLSRQLEEMPFEFELLNDKDSNFSKVWSNLEKISLIGDWPELDSICRSKEIHKLSFLEGLELSLLAMAKLGNQSWDNGFSEILPEINYMKKSSVEELAIKNRSRS